MQLEGGCSKAVQGNQQGSAHGCSPEWQSRSISGWAPQPWRGRGWSCTSQGLGGTEGTPACAHRDSPGNHAQLKHKGLLLLPLQPFPWQRWDNPAGITLCWECATNPAGMWGTLSCTDGTGAAADSRPHNPITPPWVNS